jgi:DNA modification methylase
MKDTNIKEKLFGTLDFNTLVDNTDFKEDSVRELIIMPILKELCYPDENIIRSKALQHPFLKTGSTKRAVNLVPDYILKISDDITCVLDAKAPNQIITEGDNVEQVYSYAIHPEIRAKYFALCNGIEFVIFETNGNGKPELYFKMEDFDRKQNLLHPYLLPDHLEITKNKRYDSDERKYNYDFQHYPDEIINYEIKPKKQAAKRHYGVHGYSTKQVWNVVAKYINYYSLPGDIVLDPFGGSGVTAIEAMMNERKAIHIDINPFSNFMVDALTSPIDIGNLQNSFDKIKKEYVKNKPKTKKDIEATLKKYKGPRPLKLPKGSDVPTADKLFSREQTAQLALLKSLIKKEKDKYIRETLMLMFSGLVTKVNLTYHTSKFNEGNVGGGNASAFQYYRYRIAPNPTKIDIMKYFEIRLKKILAAKKEMEYYINENTISNLQIVKGTATDLKDIPKESIDYIYTDPPYGKKIQYLDLSAMWNAWLDLDVSEEDYQLEAIEGGEHNKSKGEYNSLIAQSIKEMYRVLKYEHWLSFVFAHKDPEFWHLIVETAERCGFEYKGTVAQGNGQSSFKKRQNPWTVLSGQLIINFRKVRNPKTLMKAELGMDISDIITQSVEGIIAKNNGATIEEINNELVIKGMELNFLDLLAEQFTDINPFLKDNFDYDTNTQKFMLRKNTKFKSHIPLESRIKYYMLAYLGRMELVENKYPTFDEIVLHIMPLLKNGVTPDEQTILNVLENEASRDEKGCWRLKTQGQKELF